MGWNYGWAPYVPVAERKRKGLAAAKKQLKAGDTLSPIILSGRSIATTFWGKAWCDHLGSLSDYGSRLPRGRTLAKNGSIVDLKITSGQVGALVCGSELYRITITIKTIPQPRWKKLCAGCETTIHTVVDLLKGKLSNDIVGRLTHPREGMFPQAKEISMSCSCPDGAYVCKHLAATMYGIGHRLDTAPELMFLLRGVNQADLVSASLSAERISQSFGLDQPSGIATEDLGDIFGIELAPGAAHTPVAARSPRASKAKLAQTKPKSKAKADTKLRAVAKSVPRKRSAAEKSTNKKPAKRAAAKQPIQEPARQKATRKKPAKRTTVAPEFMITLD